MNSSREAIPGPPARRPSLLAGGIIVFAALVAYHNSFHGPFFFDDRVSITDNPSIRSLWPLGPVFHPPLEVHGVAGRPLFNLSFAINYALSGTDVWSYHATNLIIHILAGLTLFGIMRRSLERWSGLSPTRSSAALSNERVRDNPLHPNTAFALAVALIWTVHPLQTEAVTYVSQRAESLMGLFYLLTLYCFIRSVDAGSRRVPGDPRWDAASTIFQVFSVTACLLGMATKEVMVTAPLMVFLYDRTFVSGSFRAAWRERRRLYLGLAGTWLFLWYLMANFSGEARPSVGLGVVGSWWLYLLTECRVIVRYLDLAVWPHPLVFDYGIWVPRATWELAPYVAIVIALVVGTAWALFLNRKEGRRDGWRALGFAGAWFFVILAPTSSVVAVASQPMAEHRMYLPLAAVIAVAVCGGYALLERVRRRGQEVDAASPPRFERGTRRDAASTFIPVFVVVIVCLWLTVQRNEDYRSELAMWSETVAKAPLSERAQGNLGMALADEQRWPEAIVRYEEALRLAPYLVETRYNLAYALFRVGRLPEAVAAYEEVVRQKPDYVDAYVNLGNVLAAEQRWPEAITRFEQALSLAPNIIQARYNLGVVFTQLGQMDQAAEQFAAVSRLEPDNVEIHNVLGVTLAKLGRTTEAANEFEAALRLKPDDAEARANLAQLGAPPSGPN